ncbi:uncharacterized protein RCC_07999 [Ramularia collo-cygni]|uniref:Uncharacterized protein n=1 Tax=Ramularia collo-cygni TaxID=112498 RepID=A0A2D3V9L5_9PEZI|nr:uncharacterized protein RCC_07999 [Ramularia collo-cygni]CZT22130.1 uncharacterized protein RCC_07999 [Ramularia collo-cygni]
MPSRPRPRRPAMFNTPAIRTGGMGALQVESLTNRPLSIQRRHIAASQLRMREIEPDELSQSQWVQFLVMEGRERERWIADFSRRRRESSASSSSSSSDSDNSQPQRRPDRETAYHKEEEARAEAADAARRVAAPVSSTPAALPPMMPSPTPGSTPFVSLWVRHLEDVENGVADTYTVRRPRHLRRSVDTMDMPPPAYGSIVAPPPAYEPRSDDEGSSGEGSRARLRRWTSEHLGRS